MATRTICPVEIPERTTFRYRATLVNELREPLAPPQLDSLTLTLYALDAFQTIINGLDDQNILNADRGTLGPQGLLTVTLLPADTIILKAGPDRTESRILLLEATYAGGTKAARHEVRLTIRNLAKVL